jgi:hypothetical protein
MRDMVAKAVITVPVLNEITQDGIITSLHLETYAWLGMTYGAWFKLGMGIALLLLIVERSISIVNKVRRKGD